jgi:hypothetical protein
MPIVDYRTVYPYVQTATSPIARPMLLIAVRHAPHPAVPLVALVDSGADVSTFHLDIAAQLRIDLGTCRVSGVRGVGGQAQAYSAPVELDVEGRRFVAEVRFTSGVPLTLALLGRHDVFEQFQFGFDQRGRRLLIEPYA